MRRILADLPGGFAIVPTRSSAEFDRWSSAVVEPATPLGTIETDLRRLAGAIAAEPDQVRQWFVAIPSPPEQRRIAAFGWLSAEAARGVTRSDLAERAAAGIPAHARSLTMNVSLHDLDRRTALIVHQFRQADATESMLIERCGAILLDSDGDVLVRLELTAVDLRAFLDPHAVVLAILESVSILEDAA